MSNEAVKFDAFDFMNKRKDSVEPTDSDLLLYNHFTFNRAMSMSRNIFVTGTVLNTNSMAFSKLTKKQQCLSITSLDGIYLGGKWALPRKEFVKSTTDYYDKIIKVFDCSMSQAKSMVLSKLVDPVDIDEAFSALFDEQKVKKLSKRKLK